MRQANYLNSHNSFLLSAAASNSFHIIHLSPSLQEASSSSPNCSLLLLPNCLQSLIRSCSGFHASILWPLGCSLTPLHPYCFWQEKRLSSRHYTKVSQGIYSCSEIPLARQLFCQYSSSKHQGSSEAVHVCGHFVASLVIQ